jgi:Cu-Zn family superoxide dismutase
VTRASAGRASVVVVAEDKKAICVLTGSAGVAGTVTFTQSGDGPTKVVASFTGLAVGKHGFHIHEFGDTTNGCMSTGPHFNPNGKKHGSPTDEERHAGDLGNILATADACEWEMEDVQIPLSGPNSIIGRAVVVHELEDDLGKGDSSEIGTQGKTSCTTGNAGARLACGVIGLTSK